MREKYSKIPANTFQNLVVNAGILLSSFDPSAGTVAENAMLGPTSGGVNFTTKPSFKDWGEDIDNCPKNTKELKRLENWDVKISGSFVACSPALVRRLCALADLADGKITPRDTVDIAADFADIWLVGDYSDKNTGSGAGFIAIRLMDTLSTGGFQLQTTDKDKGKFAFEFTAHYSLDAQDTVPFEIYIKAGTSAPGIALNMGRASVAAGDTLTLTATTNPASATITWDSTDDDVASVDDGVVTGVAAGYAVISASITESSKTYTEICTVTVTPAAAP